MENDQEASKKKKEGKGPQDRPEESVTPHRASVFMKKERIQWTEDSCEVGGQGLLGKQG